MTTTQYQCSCDGTHTMHFANGYKPFARWLMTCPVCRKYTLQRLLACINPSQGNNGPVIRRRAA